MGNHAFFPVSTKAGRKKNNNGTTSNVQFQPCTLKLQFQIGKELLVDLAEVKSKATGEMVGAVPFSLLLVLHFLPVLPKKF